ncbi:Afi1p NDAI_0C01490 [Naumovozyma dairenensis CBS 421]|uniref:Arf3-interacting protein 1 N-terminal domain-containing protein n=1 Tax=Naumovozyma dairenensis (strain ATCC 10597 / BCRC 20456 / CBS 421 / NBRC 0211 / NRRL Y-12639) TaxID=1071378 RepID=G0W7P9_NAUDC|nr:hypothetical protein NDAI_0C01490 [Naumovozyma dairenensis CBS 421]CCD23810.1 hypothetical protein NDAI_0C01490 [Naumovozyma dairenensis CBS 421]
MLQQAQTIKSTSFPPHSTLNNINNDNTTLRKNIEFILSAVFDNRLGPTIKYQYPKSIPGFKYPSSSSLLSPGSPNNSSNPDEPLNLANLMLPNNVEKTPGKADFTVFILYHNKITQTYQLFPPSSKKIKNAVVHSSANNTPKYDKLKRYSILVEDDETADKVDALKTTAEAPLFFINVVNTVLDETNDRGAIIKSLAVGTTLKNFNIFKPLLLMTLHFYMLNPRYSTAQTLIDCFNMLNSLDLSIVQNLHSKDQLQYMFNSIMDQSVLQTLFDPNKGNFKKILKCKIIPHSDEFGNKILFHNETIHYYFDLFKPTILPKHFSKIPLQVSLIKSDPINISLNYSSYVLNFLNQFIPFLQKLDFSKGIKPWKLLVTSTNETKSTLSDFIIALSNLVSCFTGKQNNYFMNKHILIFPYMDISIIDALRKFLEPTSEFHDSFTIVGTGNPIFQFQTDIWDYYYDMDSEILYDASNHSNINSNSLEKLTLQQELRNSSTSLKKLFAKPYTVTTISSNNSSNHDNLTSSNNSINIINHGLQRNKSHSVLNPSSHSRIGLLQKFIPYLIQEQHDNQTVIALFKRVNMLQLIFLLNSPTNKNINVPNEMSLQDEYLWVYKDFIIFAEFFTYSELHIIRILITFENNLQLLVKTKAEKNISNDKLYTQLTTLLETTQELLSFVTLNKSNLERFINVLQDYPTLRICHEYDLIKHDFNNTSLSKLVRPANKNASLVESFIENLGFNLLTSFLISFDTKEQSKTTTGLNRSQSLFKDFAPSRKNKNNLMRSSSVKRLLRIHNHSSSSDVAENTPQVLILRHKADTFPSVSSSSGSSDRTDTKEINLQSTIEKRILSIKHNLVRIIYKIERHPVGQVLVKRYIKDDIREVYDFLKIEFSSPLSPTETAASIPTVPEGIPMSPQSFSSSRKDLVKELNMIEEQQVQLKIASAKTSQDNSVV